MILLSLSGCLFSKQKTLAANTQPIELTPAIWFSPSATGASLPYHNACGEDVGYALADPFTDVLTKKLRPVFSDITTHNQSEDAIASEGVIEVGIGLRRLDLALPEKTPGNYPAKATIGVEMIFLARDGTLLFNKKLQGFGLGMVEVGEQSCEVRGIDTVVKSALDAVTEDLAKEVSNSRQIRDYAAQRQTWIPLTARARSSGSSSADRARLIPDPVAAQIPPPPPVPAVQTPVLLSFRSIIRDENRDQVLQSGESIMVEIEVKNEGAVEARDVKVVVEGKSDLMALFPNEIVLGVLQPGEARRASVTKQIPDTTEGLYGELALKVRTTTPLEAAPPTKIFTFGMRPRNTSVDEVVDVDRMPPDLAAFRQPKAIAITIGIEKFSHDQLAPVKYAAHDAEVMAEYLRTIEGIPGERLRLLLNEQAQRKDFEELFEQWLPKRVDSDTVIYVFFTGRAFVDGATGAVFLAPYDGTGATTSGLYPIRRLQEMLNTLPVQRAILFFDVSVDPLPGTDLASVQAPDWGSGMGRERKDRDMWMVGNRGLQEAHVYESGKHGLFTYFLLRGLQGLADVDRDGMVIAGELCTYVRGQVSRVAREQFGDKQDPICLPPMGVEGMVRIHPLSRGNNPKPVPVAKPSAPQATPSPSSSPSISGPTRIGP